MKENNLKYRTKPQICEDVAKVLSIAVLHYGTKYAVLKDAIWVWSTFEGKHSDSLCWSIAAQRLMKNQKRIPKDVKEKLTHEHSIPKSIIIQKLLNLPKPTQAAVKQILTKYCIAVIITREEDKKLNDIGLRSKMPDDWDNKDVYARYHRAKIDITQNK